MNPNENNPTSPFGAGGMSGGGSTPSSSSIPSPIDYTNPSTMSGSGSLSMADSLASAQDNLTSAGQAAHLQDDVPGLGQLGADAPSATMLTPNQPLTPADPVPGSIGSVTSVPPLKSDDSGMGMNSGSSSMPSMASAAGSTTTPSAAAPASANVMPSLKPAASGAGTTSLAGQTTAAGVADTATGAKPYYNPFARNSMNSASTASMVSGGAAAGSTAATSSTAVPPALQPPVEKFSDRLSGTGKQAGKKGSSKMMTVLAWVLVLLLATSTVVFAILWQVALSEKEVVYLPTPEPSEPTEPGGDVDVVSKLSCRHDLGGTSDGLENLVDHYRVFTATYKNGELDTLDRLTVYNFTDNEAAEAGRGSFDETTAYFNGIGEGLGITPVAVTTEVVDNTLNYDVMAASDQLVGEYIDVFGLGKTEDGAAIVDKDSIQAAYEGAGMVCTYEDVAE